MFLAFHLFGGVSLTVPPLDINCIVVFEWVIPILLFFFLFVFFLWENGLNNNPVMHLLLINIKGGTHDYDLELHSSEICSDMKHFLLVKVSSQAVCSTMQYVKSLHFCLWRQKCNCKQQHDSFSQPGFPHWNWKSRKIIKMFELLGALWCNVTFSSLPTTQPADWPAVTTGNLFISWLCPWNCILVEDKPLGGVCKAMMFVDHAVGNSAD